MRKILYILALLLLITRPGVTLAGQAMTLTVDECVDIGIENSHKLHSSMMEVQSAKSKSAEARSYQLPTVSARASYAKLSEVPPFIVTLPPNPIFDGQFTLSPTVTSSHSLDLYVTQPLFTGFRLSSGLRAAERSADATEFDYTADSSDLSFDIRVAYWNLYKAIELRKAAAENVTLVEAHLRDTQNFLDKGLLTRNELLKVQTQLSQSRLMLLETENSVRLAQIGLNSTIGLPLSTEVVLASEAIGTDGEAGNLDSLKRVGLTARPELQALRHRIRAGEAAVTMARSGFYPQVMLSGNYNYSKPNPRILPTRDQWDDSWSVGVAVSYDIWNWGRTYHQASQAKAQLNMAKDAMAQLKDAVEFEITADYLSLLKANEAVKVASDGVAQADESLRITRSKFDAGVASTTDLLDTEVALFNARTSYTHAIVDRQLAQARLRSAVGD
ncbi:MAG: TolC family protein [candidate division Zixibacteria bacterium]|nr:TolC family protein [candidate division Zixibacteria bacterium]MBU1470824.1 TolC family protein [candidate division Zixibacteria bacterium]MBU2625756.1 TolC family protein [candidate division Zixibacteria bacterium]